MSKRRPFKDYSFFDHADEQAIQQGIVRNLTPYLQGKRSCLTGLVPERMDEIVLERLHHLMGQGDRGIRYHKRTGALVLILDTLGWWNTEGSEHPFAMSVDVLEVLKAVPLESEEARARLLTTLRSIIQDVEAKPLKPEVSYDEPPAQEK